MIVQISKTDRKYFDKKIILFFDHFFIDCYKANVLAAYNSAPLKYNDSAYFREV